MIPVYAALILVGFLTASQALAWDTVSRRRWLVQAAYRTGVDGANLLVHYTEVLPFLALAAGMVTVKKFGGRLFISLPTVKKDFDPNRYTVYALANNR